MPGIVGFYSASEEVLRFGEGTVRRMCHPIVYSPRQAVQTRVGAAHAVGVVTLGEGFGFQKSALAERDGVIVAMDGEVFPDAAEVPSALAGGAATIQRAEYCLHRYLIEGPSVVERLNGTFGLAYVDTRSGHIHLSADRFGHRWLFYWGDGQTCAFSTSVRSLLLCRDDIGRCYDTRALAELIVFERVLGDRTLFCDIKRLPAGSRATWNGRNWEVQPFFKAKHRHERGGLKSWKDASAELVVRLRRSLEKRLADRAKTGLFLSGGLDSRLVLGCCPGPVVGCTYAHPDQMPAEARVAARLAAAAGVPCLPIPRAQDYYSAIAVRAAEVNEGLSTFVGCHSLGLHPRLAQEGIRVVLTGDRSDVAFKDYFAGAMDMSDLTPWVGDLLQRRRAARKLMSSPIIRRAHRQDLMILALNAPMKLEFTAVFERCLEELQDRFRTSSAEVALAEIGLADWQGLTSMGFVRGLATEFIERSPFFDNDVWNLAMAIPPEWRVRARIVRRAVGLASPSLARIRDVSTGIPPCVSWPWDAPYAAIRRSIRNGAKRLSRYSDSLGRLRPASPGTAVFCSSGSHDRDAALRQCPAYRDLVAASIAQLPSAYFDLPTIQKLLSADVSAETPRLGGLFEILITFAQFHVRWGEKAARQAACTESTASAQAG